MTDENYSIASHAYGRYCTEFVAYFLLTIGAAYASCSLLSSVLSILYRSRIRPRPHPHKQTPHVSKRQYQISAHTCHGAGRPFRHALPAATCAPAAVVAPSRDDRHRLDREDCQCACPRVLPNQPPREESPARRRIKTVININVQRNTVFRSSGQLRHSLKRVSAGSCRRSGLGWC